MIDIKIARKIVSEAIGEAENQKQAHLLGVSTRKILVLPVDAVQCLVNALDEANIEIKDKLEKNALLIRQLGSLSFNKFLDITGSEGVEVKVRHDGTVLWVNTVEGGCVLRICRIKSMVVEDERKVKS